MSDLHHDRPPNLLERLRIQHQESNAMLAILMAGIAALFIIGIVVVFNYASKDVSTAQSPPAASAPSTTGSGVMSSSAADRSPPRRGEQDDAEGLPKRP